MMAVRASASSRDRAERAWMRKALTLAARGWGRTAPNPMVGAVLVRDGTMVGRGFHAGFGDAHAETVALSDAGPRARGATLFVTLEPCNHHGKTPPCVDALIAAGVRRVVAAVRDPGAESGGGAERLRSAGIEVDVGVEEAAARELNAPFFFGTSGATRPWVTVKLAVSIDGGIAGGIAGGPGAPRWLTGEAARKYVHRMRAGSDAVGVGIGTVLADDPLLTVRHGRRPSVAPLRVVFDREARTPLASRLVKTARRVPTLILADGADPGRVAALEARGAKVSRASGIVFQLELLRQGGVRSLLVEGGGVLAGALLAAGVVDRLVIFQAPVLLGEGAVPAFAGQGKTRRAGVVERREFAGDLMTVYAIE